MPMVFSYKIGCLTDGARTQHEHCITSGKSW